MATQGMVTVTNGDLVIAKAVCGCNGYTAAELAKLIRQHDARDAEQIERLAKKAMFGCEDCRVVMDAENTVGCDDVGPLYRETFHDPKFNPRWECGIVDRLEIVDLPW